MCPTLFFIPREIGGWPMFGPGLLLAVWAVASVGLLTWLAWRQGWNADTWGYVPILLLIGAIVRWALPALSEPEGLPIRGFGVMNMLGVIAATWLAAWRGKRVGLNPDLIFSLVFWMLVPGIIGARAFYVIEYWSSQYWPAYASPGGSLGLLLGRIVNIAEGGLVMFGAFFGGMAGLLAFVRRHRLPLLALCDLIAPSMVLGLAIGRIGCLMRGCCYGAVCACPWAITFPADPPLYSPAYLAQVERGQMHGFMLSGKPNAEARVLAVRVHSQADRAGLKSGDILQSINGHAILTAEQAHWAIFDAFHQRQPLHIQIEDRATITVPAIAPPERSLPVHPTQIYSVFDGLLLCLVLLCWSRFRRRDGEVFALLMSIYPVTRFLIESLRTDEAAIMNTGMSISQNVSLLILICAAALWFYVLRQPKGTAFSSLTC